MNLHDLDDILRPELLTISESVNEDLNAIELGYNDGSIRVMRVAGHSGNIIKDIFQYLIRSREFDQLKRLVSVNGKDVSSIVKKLFPGDTISLESSGNDTVKFEVDSENAYNHIMKRFGSVIDWEGDSMVIPRKYWGDVQEIAYAAGGEAREYGDIGEEGVAEGSSDRRKQEQEADKWLEKRIMKCTCPTSARNNPKCPVHGKKKGVAEGANGKVEAYGYTYNNRDQRVVWRKIFPSTEAAYAWAEKRNATVLSTRQIEEGILDETLDTEFQAMLNFARHHYPDSKDDQEAFMRFAFNALKHSEQEDTEQDRRISDLSMQVRELMKAIRQQAPTVAATDQAESSEQKIAGRHDPVQFDAMVKRLGQRAKTPLRTVFDPVKGVYKNVPAKNDKR